jgi:hypothetical protein
MDGPLTVIGVKQDDYGHLSTVRLQLPHQCRAHDWFACDKIKEYNHSQATKWPLRVKPPVPDVVLVEGYEEHVVEQILSRCKKGKPQMEWLVRWQGMGPVEISGVTMTTLIPEENVYHGWITNGSAWQRI